MDVKQRQLANKYIDLVLRRKIFIVALLILSLPVALGVYLTTPKVYEASTLLSYQQQKISPNKLSPDVASRIRDIVSTLTQIVTSRTNLEKIILDLDLYTEMRKIFPMEDVVDGFRKTISIRPSRRGDIFTISFSGTDPRKVVRVANAVAAKFIEENLKYRQERATATTSYTNEELLMAKKVMDKQENAMRDYKLQYYNEMPEQREVNMVRLTSLQEQQQGKQESIQDLERTLVLIQDQLRTRRKLLQEVLDASEGASVESVALAGGMETPESDKKKLLAKLRMNFDTLSMKYTDQHPEIKRLRKLITKLQVEIGLETTADSNGGGPPATDDGHAEGSKDRLSFDQVLLQLEAQQKNVEFNLQALKKEKQQIQAKIEKYENWVAAAPVREAEWSSLTREYGQLKRHYEYLVAQNLEAKSMLNLERRQRGSQFKIEDPARIPEKPIKPNFLAIIGLGGIIGLGLGLGGSLALDYFDNSVRDPETVEALFGVPLISTIPYVETGAEQRKRRLQAILAASLLGVLFLLVASVFLVAWHFGYIII